MTEPKDGLFRLSFDPETVCCKKCYDNDYKKSTHYFMCHMTQEEWEELNKNHDIVKCEFNRIKK